MSEVIRSKDLRGHIKTILNSPTYNKKSNLGIDDLISSLVANFEKNVALNKKFPDLKIKKDDEILFDKQAWNNWCELDRNRLPLKLLSIGLESKAEVGQVTVKTTTGSKKELIKEIHRLEDLVNSLKI